MDTGWTIGGHVMCNKLVNVQLDMSTQPANVHVELQRRAEDDVRSLTIEADDAALRKLMRDGAHAHSNPLLYRHDIAFVLIHNSSNSASSHDLIFIDLKNEQYLGKLPTSSLHNSGIVRSVEVFSADVSPDRKFLAFTLAVVTDTLFMSKCESGHCYLILYEIETWDMLMKIETGSFVTPAVAFDPSMPACRPQMTLMYAENGNYERPILTTFDIKSLRATVRTPFVGMELDGDTTTQLVYTADGTYLILMVLEDMWHDKTSLARLFAIRSSTLSLEHRYPASTLRPCHPECVFALTPLLHQCGTQFVVHRTRFNQEYREQSYPVPPSIPKLKSICRNVILRLIPVRSKVHRLQVPRELRQYLLYQSRALDEW